MKSKTDLTFTEVCELLKKSKRTVSRYIKKGLITPERIKSQRGTLEYRFKQTDLKNLKPGIDKTRTGKTRQVIRQDSDIVNLLREQLIVKDKQIKSLGNKIDKFIDRQRETNYLLKGLQDKILLLENKTDTPDRQDKTRQDTGQKIRGFFKRLFKGE
ncbi:MAG: helix-turn-helix domain-containing protein [Chloroflexota bacterium]|nr:helix-turn-helix domain-containing protein [Chloroflexota bacterium]